MGKVAKKTAGQTVTAEGFECHFENIDDCTVGFETYTRPGHTPELFPGTEVVEFSPSSDLARTMQVVTANMS
jgi:hypothetical protein